MRAVIALLAAGLALALAGCGTLVIIPKGAETVIKNVVRQRAGLQATNVSCPSNVHARAGNSFNCHFSAGGRNYIAHMNILRVKGSTVYYNVSTSPA